MRSQPTKTSGSSGVEKESFEILLRGSGHVLLPPAAFGVLAGSGWVRVIVQDDQVILRRSELSQEGMDALLALELPTNED